MKTPHEIGMGKKPDLVAIHTWGCNIWVKQLDVRKLKARAKVGCFVGIDTESKGYQIYWPGQNRVTIKRDMYFNENKAHMPEEVPIEGGNKIFTNSKIPQPSNNSQTAPECPLHIENVPHTPMSRNIDSPTTRNPKNATESPFQKLAPLTPPGHIRALIPTL